MPSSLGIIDAAQQVQNILTGTEFADDLVKVEDGMITRNVPNIRKGDLIQPKRPGIDVFNWENFGARTWPCMFILWDTAEPDATTYTTANCVSMVHTIGVVFAVRHIDPELHFFLRSGYAMAALHTLQRAGTNNGPIFQSIVANIAREGEFSLEGSDEIVSTISLRVEVGIQETTQDIS